MSGPARTSTHGPPRKVIEVVTETDVPDYRLARRWELLSCGHIGRYLRPRGKPAVRRRCGACLPTWLAEEGERRRVRHERALAEGRAREPLAVQDLIG